MVAVRVERNAVACSSCVEVGRALDQLRALERDLVVQGKEDTLAPAPLAVAGTSLEVVAFL